MLIPLLAAVDFLIGMAVAILWILAGHAGCSMDDEGNSALRYCRPICCGRPDCPEALNGGWIK